MWIRAVLAAAALAASVSVASATIIVTPVPPTGSGVYPTPGTQTSPYYTFTAGSNGPIVAYFAGQDAGYDQYIGLLINGTPTGITGLMNHSSSIGDSLTLGYAHPGDVLVFFDYVIPTSTTYYTNNGNGDGLDHTYIVNFAGASPLPAGILIAFEDLPHGGDLDYNDMKIVVLQAVPEPSTWAMLLLGFAGVAGFAHRRARKIAALG